MTYEFGLPGVDGSGEFVTEPVAGWLEEVDAVLREARKVPIPAPQVLSEALAVSAAVGPVL